MTGDDLVDFRRRRGFTQQQLADTTGLPVGSIARIERGGRPTDNQRRSLLLVGVREDHEAIHGDESYGDH